MGTAMLATLALAPQLVAAFNLISGAVSIAGKVAKSTAAINMMSGAMKYAKVAMTAAGTAAKWAFANPLLTVAIVAVAGFAAVLVRSIVTNESWSESCYGMARAVGLFRTATQDLGQAQKELGQNTVRIQQLEAQAAKAQGAEQQIIQARKIADALQDRINLLNQMAKLEAAAGQDSGAHAALETAEKKLGIAQAHLDTLRNQRLAQSMKPMTPDVAAMQQAATAAKATADAMTTQPPTFQPPEPPTTKPAPPMMPPGNGDPELTKLEEIRLLLTSIERNTTEGLA
jgi:hypothetical protein